MTRPIPPELLTSIEEHEHWVKTLRGEGRQFAQQGVDLHDLDLSGRDLSSAALSRARFDKARLYATDLSIAILQEGSFVQAIMDHALLTDADATGSDFSEASLRRVRGISTEFMEANLYKANLTEGNFYDADFQKANLEGANFSNANLRGAYFAEARLAHAIFTGVALWKASLKRTTGLETATVDWIDIGEEGTPERLEGEAARRWLLEEAAKQD